MIVVDANVLLYAYNASDPRHGQAAAWLEAAFGGSEDVGLPLTAILAFARISTDPRVFERPRDPDDAIELIRQWLDRSNVHLIGPTERHWDTLGAVVRAGKARGSTFMDAHIAALAMERGATLASTDRDFARFPGLRTIDPTTEPRSVSTSRPNDAID